MDPFSLIIYISVQFVLLVILLYLENIKVAILLVVILGILLGVCLKIFENPKWAAKKITIVKILAFVVVACAAIAGFARSLRAGFLQFVFSIVFTVIAIGTQMLLLLIFKKREQNDIPSTKSSRKYSKRMSIGSSSSDASD